MDIGMDYATCAGARASRVIVSILYPIGLGFPIDNSNGGICAKGQNACIIRSIAANEASENSRVVLGYGEMRSEAKPMVRFTKNRGEKQNRVKSMLCFNPCSTKPDFRNVQTAIFKSK